MMQHTGGGNPFLNVSREDLNFMKRQITFIALVKNFDECDLHCLINGFMVLAQNDNSEKDVMNMFISQQSMSENFRKLFGYSNESLALRFYTVLASGVNFDRVYLPTYLFRVHALFSPELTD